MTKKPLPVHSYSLCRAEPLIVGRTRVEFTSVTGQRMAHMTLNPWFTYVVLPQVRA